ncbi:PREDICTED: F-box only protein 22-like [Wasmannia auropunctata]|uniref:F-box only protein 22-like n=1 Tax=Wasmannia auropunctata TaxID=64793 RepID=UPI0005F082E6|nr:PREDICTED: F-box only protein 22-like [Wasmannia auropunctata]
MEEPKRKRIRKEKPSVSKNDDDTQSNENTLDTSTYLTYDILRILFKYLDARDLASSAMVCRSWQEAANNEKLTRGPCCFIQHYKTRHDFLSHVKNIRIKPSAGFFFIPENTPRNVEERIEALLPKYCEAVMLYSRGVIMDKEMEYHPFPNMACAFLPEIPNVRVKSFNVTTHALIDTTVEYQEIISIINKTSTSNHETSTCLMLFCNYIGHITAKRWASVIQKSTKNKVVSVWGGVLQDIYAQRAHTGKGQKKPRPTERTHKPCCFAVLITGAMQTWSMILERKYNTKERVEARLKLFKDQVKLKKHSIGFMFVCKARGTEMYDESNVESTIFKRIFPKVPLVGCFGYGEFGKTTDLDEVNEETNSKEGKKRKKSWYNEFSTVFLILTYG